MDASELKKKYKKYNPGGHFFDRDTMRFFGDTMANFGCRKAVINTREGIKTVYELWRKKPVKHGLKSSAYFTADTFQCVFKKEV